ncbi:MAG TPA: hypothetical protein VES73_07500 [Lamprocystis sp. (in: g-proteobacteria)]|nr:hypothetical protein [Lamprocystis sp. (in: g-proteobacteria)]
MSSVIAIRSILASAPDDRGGIAGTMVNLLKRGIPLMFAQVAAIAALVKLL